MSIFERWLGKKPPKQPKHETVVEPEQPKNIIDVGWDVILTMKLSEEETKKLYNSLEKEEPTLLGHGSLFVSEREFDYFLDVMRKFHKRPVILIDFNDVENPSQNLRTVIEEYQDKPSVPVVFVKNYFQDRADELDPRSKFDSWLRGRVQNAGWAAIIHGNRYAPALSGNIAGSSSSTEMAKEEMWPKKKNIEQE